MPRLLIDGTPIQPNPKGVGRYAQQVCSRLGALLPADWTIDLLVEQPSAELFSKDSRLNVIVVPARSELYRGLILFPRYARKLRSQIFLKTNESAGRIAGLPTVAVCHDIDELIWKAQEGKVGGFRRALDHGKQWFRRRALRECNFVLCNSDFIREAVQRRYGIPAETTRVAHCAVDERFYDLSRLTDRDAVRRKYGVERFILVFATGDPRENFNAYPAIAARMMEIGLNTCLLVAGVNKNAEYGHSLREKFVARGLEEGRDFVLEEFLGATRFSDLVDLYTAADFYSELSLHEGFGMQLVEAMACGTTCVSSPNGALREVGDRYALFVDPTDASAVANCFKQAYENEQEKRDNAEQVRYTHKFSWAQTARTVAEALMKAASGPNDRQPASGASGG
jgi:glycosyltransferase involved in cell wall biosynthesis